MKYLILAFLIGCGIEIPSNIDVTYEDKTVNNPESKIDEFGNEFEVDNDENQTEKTEIEIDEPKEIEIDEPINENESIVDQELKEIEIEEEIFVIYDPKLRDWYGATANAPEGFKLPTRAEILQLVSEYDLGRRVVWTSEFWSTSDQDVWVIALSNEAVFPHCGCMYHETVYVRE